MTAFARRLLFAIILVACLTGVFAQAQEEQSPVRDPIALAARLLGYDEPYPLPLPTPVYEIGAELEFWVTKAGEDAPARVMATLGGATPNVYLWVEDGIEFDPDGIQLLAGQLEGLLAGLRRDSNLGMITSFDNLLTLPDVDFDPHVYVLFTRELAGNAEFVYNPNDSLPTQLTPGGYSNQHEVIAVNTTFFGDAPPGDSVYVHAIVRAFYDLLAYYHHPEQAPWLTEALGWLIAIQGQTVAPPEDALSLYLQAPNVPLYRPSTPLTRDQLLGGQQLFLSYVQQRYGNTLVEELFEAPGDALAPLDLLLQENEIIDSTPDGRVTGRDVFADFALASALNSLFGDGRFVHSALTPDQFAAGQVLEADQWADLALSQQTVNQFGLYYLRLLSPEASSFKLSFEGQPGVPRLGLPAEIPPDNHFYWSGNGRNRNHTLTHAVDLRRADSALFLFDVWYELADQWNYVYLEASTDGGETWEIIPTPGSSTVNRYGMAYGPGFTGNSNPEQPRPSPFLGVLLASDNITVTEALEDTPASEAGLRARDVVIGYDGHFWPGQPSVFALLANLSPGDVVDLYVQRGSERLSVPVELGVHPTRTIVPPPLWQHYELDLSAYAGQQFLLRFEYISVPGKENGGFLLDNIAIPEANVWDEAETDDAGWTLNGWERVDNQLQQQFLLEVAIVGSDGRPTRARRLIGPADMITSGDWRFALNAGEAFVIVVSGLNDNTTLPAQFDLSIQRDPPE